jgi:ATP phosphoribosyltransferase regulatory subunit
MSKQDRWLLPEGIEEVLPDEARRLEAMRRQVLDLFASWGYELVMPPLIEYVESLLTGVGQDMALQTFTLTDQFTGRLMGVRADMTPQAARIDAHYLKREAPVRLCYLGPVLRTRPGEFGGSREPLQLGAELFGHSGADSDAEVLGLMIATLARVGIPEPHIDLGHVGVFRALSGHAGLGTDAETRVFDALQRKARSELEALLAQNVAPAARDMLLALLDLSGGTEIIAQARARLARAPQEVRAALDNLEAVAHVVAANAGMPPLHFDLAEVSGYQYYTGVVFSAFVPGHGRAIAHGGRYDGIGRAFGRARPATGFGSDLRQLLRLAGGTAATPRAILAPAGDDTGLRAEIARLRAAGERVVQQLSGASVGAREQGCDRELVNRNGRWVVHTVR